MTADKVSDGYVRRFAQRKVIEKKLRFPITIKAGRTYFRTIQLVVSSIIARLEHIDSFRSTLTSEKYIYKFPFHTLTDLIQ